MFQRKSDLSLDNLSLKCCFANAISYVFSDVEPVVRHPEFRLFACMNPATDVGKKDLSPGIRNRYSFYFVNEVTV